MSNSQAITSLTDQERKRYSRHFRLPQVGETGQAKLKRAKVLVVGAGGLGCPVLQYLAAAGVGEISIIDGDKVSLSNLQRQILFTTHDIGEPKAKVAARRLLAMNPEIQVHTHCEYFNLENAQALVREADIVVDGTDNFQTRYLINDACVLEAKPFVYASIHQFSGQLSVFNYLDISIQSKSEPQNFKAIKTDPNKASQNSANFVNHTISNDSKDSQSGVTFGEAQLRGPTYRCLFPDPPAPEAMPSCDEAGVLGALPGVLGTLQATEVLKMILGLPGVKTGKLVLLDLCGQISQELTIAPSPNAQNITELKIPEIYCRTPKTPHPSSLPSSTSAPNPARQAPKDSVATHSTTALLNPAPSNPAPTNLAPQNSAPSNPAPTVSELDPWEFTELTGALVIDVRASWEFEEEVPAAINIPLEKIQEEPKLVHQVYSKFSLSQSLHTQPLKSHQNPPIVFICSYGKKSLDALKTYQKFLEEYPTSSASETLTQIQHKKNHHSYSLSGGIEGLKRLSLL